MRNSGRRCRCHIEIARKRGETCMWNLVSLFAEKMTRNARNQSKWLASHTCATRFAYKIIANDRHSALAQSDTYHLIRLYPIRVAVSKFSTFRKFTLKNWSVLSVIRSAAHWTGIGRKLNFETLMDLHVLIPKHDSTIFGMISVQAFCPGESVIPWTRSPKNGSSDYIRI